MGQQGDVDTMLIMEKALQMHVQQMNWSQEEQYSHTKQFTK